jgi:XRE family aerobic/anaerobic benzoate catabolism transcriptional regulator
MDGKVDEKYNSHTQVRPENYKGTFVEPQALLRGVGQRLRAARHVAGLTAAELARRAGVSRRTVTEAEAGRANLTLTRLSALARALELPLAQLVDPDPTSQRRGRIALVGLRGAGKSTVGRQLALEREVPFVELDQRIEETAGLSLSAIFELHGAGWFRKLQAEALESVLAEGENVVVATGGSIVDSEAAFARLRQTCHTVWLRARPEDHFERVVAQGDRRPMRGRPRALEELRSLLAEREAAYSRCEATVDTSGRTVDEVVAGLLSRFGA